MPPDLTVDTATLSRCATDLAGTAARVADGVTRSSPLAVVPPGWATTGALAELEVAADRRFDRLGATITGTADRLTATVEEYEAADARVATRLRAAGR
jgi:hypothetical protein